MSLSLANIAFAVRSNISRVEIATKHATERTYEGNRILLATTENFLKAVSNIPEVRTFDASACSDFLGRLLKDGAEYANIAVVDATDGHLVCSALPAQGPVSAIDRLWFQETLRTKKFSAGEYQIGRITKRAALNFGYPIMEKDTVRGVIFVAIPIETIKSLMRADLFPEGTAILFLDKKGLLVHDSENLFPEYDKKLFETDFGKRILTEKSGIENIRNADGVRRIYAFNPIGTNPDDAAGFSAIGVPISSFGIGTGTVMGMNALGLLFLAALGFRAIAAEREYIFQKSAPDPTED